MMGWGYGMGWSGWLMMAGLWLVLIIAAVAAVMWIFPRDGRGRNYSLAGQSGAFPRSSSDPLSLLADRLARGEIDVETYRALRAELTGTDRTTR